MIRGFILIAFFLIAAPAMAVEVYDFPDEEARERYQDLTWELRCPKCQNQNIADSNAPIAQDLRREVHRMVVEGHSNQEIIEFMVERYGDFVLYRPPMAGHTLILWTAPVVIALVGIIIVFMLGRRRRAAEDDDAISPQEQQRIRELLSRNETKQD